MFLHQPILHLVLPSTILKHKKQDTTKCNHCKSHVARDAVYSCPRCGRETPIGECILHCLEHCAAYMSITANDCSLCVESANWCPIHPLHTHSLQERNMKNEARFECGIDNCKKHHHKAFHGATTPSLATINAFAANQHVHSNSQKN